MKSNGIIKYINYDTIDIGIHLLYYRNFYAIFK